MIQNKTNKKINQNRGFTLIEAVIGCSLIVLVGTALLGGVAVANKMRTGSALESRAELLASEGIEAARNIRDNNFGNLINGTFGIATSSNKWIFSGASDQIGEFTRTINITTVDAATKQVISTVSWSNGPQRTGSTAVTTYFTDLSLLSKQANNLQVNISAAVIGGVNNQLRGITLQNVGANPIVIDKVTLTWTNSLRKINQININGITVWSQSGPGTPTNVQASGTLLDIVNVTVNAATTIPATYFQWNGIMSGNAFTITFTLSDGSTKAVSIPTLL